MSLLYKKLFQNIETYQLINIFFAIERGLATTILTLFGVKMLTFSNTIISSVAWLNLNNVKYILFFKECTHPQKSEYCEDCHIVIFNDNSVILVSKDESSEYQNQNGELEESPKYLSYNLSSYSVIRSKSLFRTISDLMLDE